MSQNYLKKKLVRGIDNSKVKEGQSVWFGGKLYTKHNGALKRATSSETIKFMKAVEQQREQEQ